MIALPEVPRLVGARVVLEPLSVAHGPDLAIAAEEDRATYRFTAVPRAATVEDYIDMQLRRRDEATMVPFAQVRASDGRSVGCTAYVDFRYFPDSSRLAAVMIGWTWLAASAQRTGINREAKLLLLAHAFNALGAERVDLATDDRNDRSRQAIANLGATFEGVLRSWSRSHAPGEEGRLRDTAMFSVVRREWPLVEARLRQQLAGPAAEGRRR